MPLDPDLVTFISSPVMIIIGTRGEDGRAEIGRGAGAWVLPDGAVEVVISAWQWQATVSNLRERVEVALTFSRPSDYVSYQIKGKVRLRDAGASDVMRSARYISAITETLAGLGISPDMSAAWLNKQDPVVAQISVNEVFVQTPGPAAGKAMEQTP